MKFIKLTLVVILSVNIQLVFAQRTETDTTKNKTIYLNGVEITSSAAEQRLTLSQPLSVGKISTMELKRSMGIYLEDAINTNIPGVFMQRRTISAGQQFNIRGYGNGTRGTNGVNSNFDGQGYKVYLNGIPVTDAEGITAMDDIDFGSIANVELIKGPAGTLYGQVIAGVVNLQTLKAEKNKITIGQDLMFGSYGLSRLTTRLQIGGERSSLMINYGHQQSEGFVIHTASHKDFVNLTGDFQPNNKQIFTTYIGYSNSFDERQGELTIEQWDTLDYSGNPAYIKNNAHSNIISFRAGVGHTYIISQSISNTTSVFGCGVSSNSSSAGGWTDKNPVNYGARTAINLKFRLNNNLKLNGTAGGEMQQQFAQVAGYGMVANPDTTVTHEYNVIGAMRSNQYYRTDSYSLFTEWTLVMPADLALTAGIGSSVLNIGLNDRFFVANSTKPTGYTQKYSGMLSPHIALNKIFNKQYSVYISYSQGYKAPTSSYFFIPTTGEINTGLKPETGSQVEIGSKGDVFGNRLHYEIALFSAKFSDKMTAVAIPLDPPAVGTAYSYVVNRGSQDDKGLELLLKYTVFRSGDRFFETVKPFANLAYSDFKYSGYTYQKLSGDKLSVVEVDYSGNDVAGVAPVTANVGVDVATTAGIYANASYCYRSEMPFTSDGLNKAKAYSLLNAKIGYHKTLLNHIDADLYFGANNITGTQYAYMIFINQLPDAYIPAPNEINFFGGLNLKYMF